MSSGAVQDALGGLLEPGELVVRWVATVEVVGPNGVTYLAHRAGGGADGDDRPTAWAALGMLRASVLLAEDQVREMTVDVDDGPSSE